MTAHDAGERTRPRDPVTRREQILAAQIRVTADQRRGYETEQWIIDLANEEPEPLRPPGQD